MNSLLIPALHSTSANDTIQTKLSSGCKSVAHPVWNICIQKFCETSCIISIRHTRTINNTEHNSNFVTTPWQPPTTLSIMAKRFGIGTFIVFWKCCYISISFYSDGGFEMNFCAFKKHGRLLLCADEC